MVKGYYPEYASVYVPPTTSITVGPTTFVTAPPTGTTTTPTTGPGAFVAPQYGGGAIFGAGAPAPAAPAPTLVTKEVTTTEKGVLTHYTGDVPVTEGTRTSYIPIGYFPAATRGEIYESVRKGGYIAVEKTPRITQYGAPGAPYGGALTTYETEAALMTPTFTAPVATLAEHRGIVGQLLRERGMATPTYTLGKEQLARAEPSIYLTTYRATASELGGPVTIAPGPAIAYTTLPWPGLRQRETGIRMAYADPATRALAGEGVRWAGYEPRAALAEAARSPEWLKLDIAEAFAYERARREGVLAMKQPTGALEKLAVGAAEPIITMPAAGYFGAQRLAVDPLRAIAAAGAGLTVGAATSFIRDPLTTTGAFVGSYVLLKPVVTPVTRGFARAYRGITPVEITQEGIGKGKVTARTYYPRFVQAEAVMPMDITAKMGKTLLETKTKLRIGTITPEKPLGDIGRMLQREYGAPEAWTGDVVSIADAIAEITYTEKVPMRRFGLFTQPGKYKTVTTTEMVQIPRTFVGEEFVKIPGPDYGMVQLMRTGPGYKYMAEAPGITTAGQVLPEITAKTQQRFAGWLERPGMEPTEIFREMPTTVRAGRYVEIPKPGFEFGEVRAGMPPTIDLKYGILPGEGARLRYGYTSYSDLLYKGEYLGETIRKGLKTKDIGKISIDERLFVGKQPIDLPFSPRELGFPAPLIVKGVDILRGPKPPGIYKGKGPLYGKGDIIPEPPARGTLAHFEQSIAKYTDWIESAKERGPPKRKPPTARVPGPEPRDIIRQAQMERWHEDFLKEYGAPGAMVGPEYAGITGAQQAAKAIVSERITGRIRDIPDLRFKEVSLPGAGVSAPPGFVPQIQIPGPRVDIFKDVAKVTRPGLETLQRTKLDMPSRLDTRLVPGVDIGVRQIQQPQLDTGLSTTTLLRSELDLRTSQRTYEDTIQKMKPPYMPGFPRPGVGVPGFGFPIPPSIPGGGLIGMRPTKIRKRPPRRGYQPSLVGVSLGITAPKAPKGPFTGFGIRPMVPRKKRGQRLLRRLLG